MDDQIKMRERYTSIIRTFAETEQNAHELDYYRGRYLATGSLRDALGKEMEEAGILIDNQDSNWTLAENGMYYLDIEAFSGNIAQRFRNFDLEKIRAYIAKLTDPSQQKEALSLLDDLAAVNELIKAKEAKY